MSFGAGIAAESESDSSEGIKDGEKEERDTDCIHQIQTMDHLDDLELQVRAYWWGAEVA